MGYFTVGIVSFFDWHSHIETSATGGAACRKNTTVQDERIESTVLGVSVSEQLKGCWKTRLFTPRGKKRCDLDSLATAVQLYDDNYTITPIEEYYCMN